LDTELNRTPVAEGWPGRSGFAEAPESFATSIKRSHDSIHVFKRRFDRNITEPGTLEKMIEYIQMNPVRKGLVTRAIDWKWSSAVWILSHKQHESLPVAPIPYEWTIGMSSE
jgi:hypothetical protein